MAFTLADDVAQAARLSDLTTEQTRLALAVGLFAEERLTLAQAAALAGLERLSFQSHLAERGIPLHDCREGLDSDLAELARRGASPIDKPWQALRGSAHFVGDPFAAVVSEDEIVVLQKPEHGNGLL